MSSSSSRVQVALATPQGPLEMRLYDHRHRLVTRGFERIERRLRPGLYRLQIDAGPTVDERILTIGPKGLVDTELRVEMPSAAPVEGTSTTHEYHAYPAQELSRRPKRSFGHGGRLVIFVRSMEGEQRSPVDVDSLELVDSRQSLLATGAADFEQQPADGWAGFSADVEPGGYALRLRRPRRSRDGMEETVDQSIWVEEDWTTLVFVPYRQRVGRPQPEYASVHMTHLGQGFDPYEPSMQGANLALEIALSGLRQGRAVVPRNLKQLMLRGKFGNPMLGIVGALVLLHGETNWRLFHTVRRNLQRLVPNHPDVHALHVMAKHKRGDDSGSRIPETAWPPMLYACYQGLIERDAGEESRIVPEGSIADLAASRLVAQGPWTQWRAFETDLGTDFERQLEQLMKQVKAAAEDESQSAVIDQLQSSWHRAVSRLDEPDTQRKSRPRPAGGPRLSMGFAPPEGDSAPPDRAAPEEVRLASYIENLTAQATEFDLPIAETSFDPRQLSDKVGLPRATVERAMKGLARRGFDF